MYQFSNVNHFSLERQQLQKVQLTCKTFTIVDSMQRQLHDSLWKIKVRFPGN